MTGDFLQRLDPRWKLAVVASVSTISVVAETTVMLALLVLPGLVGTAFLGVSRQARLGILVLAAVVLWGAVLTQGFFYRTAEPTVLLTLVPAIDLWGWEFPGLLLTGEGMLFGLVQGTRLVATVLVGVVAAVSTSPQRLLAALAWLGAPAWLAFVTMAALRFLPVLASQWQEVRRARWLRGAPARWWAHPLSTLGGELALIEPLLSSALRRSSKLATSITLRGFDPAARRTDYPPLRMTTAEQLATATVAAATLTLTALQALNFIHI